MQPMPKAVIAHTACSRELPQPKLAPATRMRAWRNCGRFRGKSGSRRARPNSRAAKSGRKARRNVLGAIWSVLTSSCSRGAAGPVTVWKGCMADPSGQERQHAPGVGDLAGQGGGDGGGRAGQVGAHTRALAVLEIAVAGGQHALAAPGL